MHVHSSALKKGKIRDLRTVPMFAFYLLKSVIKSYNDFVATDRIPYNVIWFINEMKTMVHCVSLRLQS